MELLRSLKFTIPSLVLYILKHCRNTTFIEYLLRATETYIHSINQSGLKLDVEKNHQKFIQVV